MPKRTVPEGKSLAERIASQYRHKLGAWQAPEGNYPDWDSDCIRKGCKEGVGVDKELGTLSYTERFKQQCKGK